MNKGILITFETRVPENVLQHILPELAKQDTDIITHNRRDSDR